MSLLVRDGLLTIHYDGPRPSHIEAQVIMSTPKGVVIDCHRIHLVDEDIFALFSVASMNADTFCILGQKDGSGKRVGDHSSPFYDGSVKTGWECLGGPVLVVRRPGQQLRVIYGNRQYLRDLCREILMSIPRDQHAFTRLQLCMVGCTREFRKRFESEMADHVPPAGYGKEWKLLLTQNVRAVDVL